MILYDAIQLPVMSFWQAGSDTRIYSILEGRTIGRFCGERYCVPFHADRVTKMFTTYTLLWKTRKKCPVVRLSPFQQLVHPVPQYSSPDFIPPSVQMRTIDITLPIDFPRHTLPKYPVSPKVLTIHLSHHIQH